MKGKQVKSATSKRKKAVEVKEVERDESANEIKAEH